MARSISFQTWRTVSTCSVFIVWRTSGILTSTTTTRCEIRSDWQSTTYSDSATHFSYTCLPQRTWTQLTTRPRDLLTWFNLQRLRDPLQLHLPATAYLDTDNHSTSWPTDLVLLVFLVLMCVLHHWPSLTRFDPVWLWMLCVSIVCLFPDHTLVMQIKQLGRSVCLCVWTFVFSLMIKVVV